MTEEISEALAGTLKTVNSLLMRLFGPGTEQLGLLTGDWAKLWRLRNLTAILTKADRILREQNISPGEGRHLALSVGLPLLERASCQDDPFLQARWAQLIASSLRKESAIPHFSFSTTFVETLHQFSRLDCEVLEFVVEKVDAKQSEDGTVIVKQLDRRKILDAFPDSPAHLSLDKLTTLGCVRSDPKLPLKPGGMGFKEVFSPTVMGVNLYIAASGKTPKGLDLKG